MAVYVYARGEALGCRVTAEDGVISIHRAGASLLVPLKDIDGLVALIESTRREYNAAKEKLK